jgi:hypothetical protein
MAVVGSSVPSLRKSWRPWASQKLLGAPNIGGGVPGQGMVVEGVKGVKYATMPPGMYENGKKTGGFAHFLSYKSPKILFFAQKYLTRYTPETLLEEYIN